MILSLDSASRQRLRLKRSHSVLLAAVMILLYREPYLVTCDLKPPSLNLTALPSSQSTAR